MIFNEVEYEIYTDKMVHNIISDEAAYIIDTRRQYVDFQDVYGILKEEVEETAEELTALQDSLEEYWKFVRGNMPPEALLKKLELIEDTAVNIINEAKQVGAVAKKARLQLSVSNGKSSCHRPK